MATKESVNTQQNLLVTQSSNGKTPNGKGASLNQSVNLSRSLESVVHKIKQKDSAIKVMGKFLALRIGDQQTFEKYQEGEQLPSKDDIKSLNDKLQFEDEVSKDHW